MFSACVSSLNFSTNEYKDICLLRFYDELDEFLFNLNDKNKYTGNTTIIYIHNLAYEYSFFNNNLKFFKNSTTIENQKDYLFLSDNKPLFIRIGYIEFRCSFLLLNKSIRTLGAELDIPKLDYDYNDIRTPLTPLTDDEIKYNFRDVEIMLKSVKRLYDNNEYINSLEELPRTKTGITRLNNKKNPNINTKYKTNKGKSRSEYKHDIFVNNREKAKSLEQLLKWESCFSGGIVFSNPYYCNKVVNNVYSIDESSAYPTQMLYRFYPYDFIKVEDHKEKVFEKLYKNEILNNTPINMIMHKPFYTFFNCTITITNIINKYDFYPLSTAKIENYADLYNTDNCLYVNGKVVFCNVPINITVTCLDLYILYMFYKFDVVKVDYLEITNKTRKNTPYKLNSIKYNGAKKKEYKKYNNMIQDSNVLKKYTTKDIPDNNYRKLVNNAKTIVEQKDISAMLYLQPKVDLNAEYGINAQHLLRNRPYFDNDKNEFIDNYTTFDEYNKTIQKTSYIYGVYIVAYARCSLLYMVHEFLKNDITIYYMDTDSIKFNGNIKKAKQLINSYNETINYMLKEYQELGFGKWDIETCYNNFTTIGTKSYITENDKILHATISGLPNASMLYNELYANKCNKKYKDLIYNYYHYNTIIDKSAIAKKGSIYNFIDEDIEVNGYKAHVYSGAIINPVDVTLRSFESSTWRGYSKILQYYFKIPPNYFNKKTIIYKDDNVLKTRKEVV